VRLTLIRKSEPEQHALPEKWAQRIFVRMSAIYGHLWTSRHGNEETWQVARREWAQALAGLDAKQIDHGIVQCRSSYKMPPTLPEFIELCHQYTSLQSKNTAQKESDYREKLEEQKQKQLTKVCIATQNGWSHAQMTPDETSREFMYGRLEFSQIEKSLEEFLKVHGDKPRGSNLDGRNSSPEPRYGEIRHAPAGAA
jgi:hypothetical protein